MQPDVTLSTLRRGLSYLAGIGSATASNETVVPLNLGERLLASLGIQAVCLIVQAAELLAGEHQRGGRSYFRR